MEWIGLTALWKYHGVNRQMRWIREGRSEWDLSQTPMVSILLSCPLLSAKWRWQLCSEEKHLRPYRHLATHPTAVPLRSSGFSVPLLAHCLAGASGPVVPRLFRFTPNALLNPFLTEAYRWFPQKYPTCLCVAHTKCHSVFFSFKRLCVYKHVLHYQPVLKNCRQIQGYGCELNSSVTKEA